MNNDQWMQIGEADCRVYYSPYSTGDYQYIKFRRVGGAGRATVYYRLCRDMFNLLYPVVADLVQCCRWSLE